jgi:hypothetical protein
MHLNESLWIMKFQIQHNGTFKVFIMISDNREEIVSTFNSFFHHGTIDEKVPLTWLNTNKASFKQRGFRRVREENHSRPSHDEAIQIRK